MTLEGRITEIVDGEGFYTFTPFPRTAMLEHGRITSVETVVTDGRQLSPAQRRKIFALVGDIAEHVSGVAFDSKRSKAEKQRIFNALQVGYILDKTDSEAVRRVLTERYTAACGIDWFSLSARTALTADMSTARDFIGWLIDLCVMNGVACSDTLLGRCEDIGRYLYACIMNRSCAVCGLRADIHEVDRVGMGRNRREIGHVGQRVQPLCRTHHDEAHDMGQQTFDARYHLESIVLTEELCDRLNWRKERR